MAPLTHVLVTGAQGFIGRHLVEALTRQPNLQVTPYDVGDSPDVLDRALAEAEVIFHLAGVNRPKEDSEFEAVNAGFTQQLCDRLLALGRSPLFVLSSSIQADLDNPYGRSKRHAECIVEDYSLRAGAAALVFRLTNAFGPGGRPNYNSVAATFCYNTVHGLPLAVSDPTRVLGLIYVSDVVASFAAVLDGSIERGMCAYRQAEPIYQVTLGDLARRIQEFPALRTSLFMPDFSDRFTQALYATYLSFLPVDTLVYDLTQRTDQRGALAEFIKQPSCGQVFVSRTLPGITRGNHYHYLKTEKFLVAEGDGVIRMRPVTGHFVTEFNVSGEQFRVVDIPPDYTHSIENVGTGVLVTLFWSSQIFDPTDPDTYPLTVLETSSV